MSLCSRLAAEVASAASRLPASKWRRTRQCTNEWLTTWTSMPEESWKGGRLRRLGSKSLRKSSRSPVAKKPRAKLKVLETKSLHRGLSAQSCDRRGAAGFQLTDLPQMARKSLPHRHNPENRYSHNNRYSLPSRPDDRTRERHCSAHALWRAAVSDHSEDVAVQGCSDAGTALVPSDFGKFASRSKLVVAGGGPASRCAGRNGGSGSSHDAAGLWPAVDLSGVAGDVGLRSFVQSASRRGQRTVEPAHQQPNAALPAGRGLHHRSGANLGSGHREYQCSNLCAAPQSGTGEPATTATGWSAAARRTVCILERVWCHSEHSPRCQCHSAAF